MNFLLYSVALFGFTFIVGHAGISQGIRDTIVLKGGKAGRFFVDLLECPACLSTWVGLCISIFFPAYAHEFAGATFGNVILFTLLSCGSSAIYGMLTGLIKT